MLEAALCEAKHREKEQENNAPRTNPSASCGEIFPYPPKTKSGSTPSTANVDPYDPSFFDTAPQEEIVPWPCAAENKRKPHSAQSKNNIPSSELDDTTTAQSSLSLKGHSPG